MSSVINLLLNSVASVVVWGTALTLILCFGYVFYNLFFHPLRRFPGPISHATSRIPYCVRLIRGTLPFDMLDLHKKYGDVVRITPNELAFSSPAAWKDIMSHRKGAEEEMGKFMKFYRVNEMDPTDIVNSDREEHGMLRRQLAHGFSDKSMRDQEPIITQYIDLLIQRLHENCQREDRPVDMMMWYNLTTFDIVGDLAFGEPFGCLASSSYHPWIKMIFGSARAGTVLQTAGYFPFVKKLLMLLVPKSVIEQYKSHKELSKQKLLRRMELGYNRPDLIEGLIIKKDEWNISIDKLAVNSGILVIGGSETTATLLSGVTHLLLTNRDALQKLTDEVRSTFKAESEININSVNGLTYMLACLDEALRMYPPVPIGLPRVVPKPGAMIDGHYVPANTIVAIHQWATYHREKHFVDPFIYQPERHLGDPRFGADQRDVLQPFHIGARNCLGRNLAYTEMRLILARVVFNFDMHIADDSKDWMSRQKIFLLWDKGPLNVYLTPVARPGP